MEHKVCDYCRGSNESCNFCGGSGYIQSVDTSSRPQKLGRQVSPKKPQKATSIVKAETPIRKWTDKSVPPYDIAKAVMLEAMRALNKAIRLKELSGGKYAKAAAEALNSIKEGRNACQFDSLKQSWDKLFKEAFYHMKNAETLYKSKPANEIKRPVSKSKTVSIKRIKAPSNSQETLMEIKLREAGYKKPA